MLVIANLSDTFQSWQPTQTDGNWQVLMHNYAEVASQPADMTLRPLKPSGGCKNSLQLCSGPVRITLPGFDAYAQLTFLFLLNN